MKRSRLRKISAKRLLKEFKGKCPYSTIKKRPPKAKTFKDGRIRVTGWDKQMLRYEVYCRAQGKCEVCGAPAPWAGPTWVRGHLAHDGHGPNRDDTPESCKWKCWHCHAVVEHGGGKPCPPKEQQ